MIDKAFYNPIDDYFLLKLHLSILLFKKGDYFVFYKEMSCLHCYIISSLKQ